MLLSSFVPARTRRGGVLYVVPMLIGMPIGACNPTLCLISGLQVSAGGPQPHDDPHDPRRGSPVPASQTLATPAAYGVFVDMGPPSAVSPADAPQYGVFRDVASEAPPGAPVASEAPPGPPVGAAAHAYEYDAQGVLGPVYADPDAVDDDGQTDRGGAGLTKALNKGLPGSPLAADAPPGTAAGGGHTQGHTAQIATPPPVALYEYSETGPDVNGAGSQTYAIPMDASRDDHDHYSSPA